jgi:hypothetical protein
LPAALIALAAAVSPAAWAAQPPSSITLDGGGAREGAWQTRDMTIHYRFENGATGLNIAGRVELAAHIRNIGYVERLLIRLKFLDEGKNVLGSAVVYNLGNLHHYETIRFEQTLPVPEGATALTFAYDGRARDGGSSVRQGEAVTWDFWLR